MKNVTLLPLQADRIHQYEMISMRMVCGTLEQSVTIYTDSYFNDLPSRPLSHACRTRGP